MKEYNVQHQAWGPLAQGNWFTQKGIVSIPKSTHKERIIANINIFDFELSHEDMNAIAKIDENKSLIPSKRNPEMVKRFANWKFNI